MITNKDIIIVGLQPWDIEIGSNCKNIALEFAKHNRVLYVNAPLDRFSSLRRKDDKKVRKRLAVRSGREEDLTAITPAMWVFYPRRMAESANILPDGPVFDWLNGINARRFASEIIRAAEKLGFKDFILFNDNSIYLGYYLKELLKPQLYIYYIRDFLIKNPYWKRHAHRLEPLLIRKADLVVANSTLYAEYAKEFNLNSFMVGQGCDVSLFDESGKTIEVATDLKPISRPVVGYVGFLSGRRLDIEVIAYLAEARKNISIVLVGPEDEHFKVSRLHTMENVCFLGPKPGNELPTYIKGFDVAINPQQINEATMGNYPRKIDEYLAMGKPVVGSATKAMDYFEEVTYLAKNREEFVHLVDRALAEDNPALQARRKEVALGHSWANNVEAIYQRMKNTLQVKNE